MGVEVSAESAAPTAQARESQMIYNKRSSTLIVAWLEKFSIKPLYIRVVHTVFKHAWRERTFPAHGGTNFLAKSRTFRDRLWWDMFKHRPDYARRREEDMVHAVGGNFSHWEDLFCDILGTNWRAVRDSCDSRPAWMHYFGEFCRAACQRGKLPCITGARATSASPVAVGASLAAKRAKTKHFRLDNLPATHGGDSQAVCAWDAGGSRFIIVSDCQPLVQVTNGHAPLASPTLAPPFHRIANHMVGLFDYGLRPYQQHLDPVVWQRRELNKKADHLVNYTMDAGSSWTKIFTPQIVSGSLMDANWILHFDGGTRGTSCSASAWILEAEVQTGPNTATHLIAMAGTYLPTAVSSFEAELIALDYCSEYFFKFIRNMHAEGSCGKRRRFV